MQSRFSQRVAQLADFQLHGIRRSGNGRVAVVGFTVDGQLALPSRSFWQWLFALFSELAPIEDEAEFFESVRNQLPEACVEYGLLWDDEGCASLTAPRSPRTRTPAHQDLPGRRVSRDEQLLFMASPAGTIRPSLN